MFLFSDNYIIAPATYSDVLKGSAMVGEFSLLKTKISISFLKMVDNLVLHEITTFHTRYIVEKSSTGTDREICGNKIKHAALHYYFYRKISYKLKREVLSFSETIADRNGSFNPGESTKKVLIFGIFEVFCPINSNCFLNFDIIDKQTMGCLPSRYQSKNTYDDKAFDIIQSVSEQETVGKNRNIGDGYYHESCMSAYNLFPFYKGAMEWQTTVGLCSQLIALLAVSSREIPGRFIHCKEFSSPCRRRKRALTENLCQRGEYMFFKQERARKNFFENSISFASIISGRNVKNFLPFLRRSTRQSGNMARYFSNYFASHRVARKVEIISFLDKIRHGVLACGRAWKEYFLICSAYP